MDYTDFEDTDLNNSQGIGFDFKGFLFKALNLWKLILLCVGVALVIAYFINVRKQNIYRLDSLITVNNDQNPFFTANTSISFNWGGVSGKVGSILTEIKTRSHNEIVIDSLEYYKEYLEEGKYHLIDIYKTAPFDVVIDKSKPQALGIPIGIRIIDEFSYELFYNFESDRLTGQAYGTKDKYPIAVNIGEFRKIYKFGEVVNEPFFNATVNLKPIAQIPIDKVCFVRFLNFDSVVNQYKNSIQIQPSSRDASSVLRLSLTGKNKSKIVDFLNATSAVLSKTELERKNLYATNTIKFIDSSLNAVNANLKEVTDEMNDFRKSNKVFDVEEEITQKSEQLKEFDKEKLVEQSKLNYLNTLENYLRTKTDYSQIAAPSSVGIDEANILSSVSRIIALSVERRNLEYSTKEGSILFNELDRRIDTEKSVLLEAIDVTKQTIGIQLNTISRKIAQLESELIGLPSDQQEFLKIQRKLDISKEAYDIYQEKKGEAAIVKAANVSDITVIDEAKDIGNAPIGPKKSLNYMMALMIGFLTPLFLIFVIYLLDNTIHGSDEIAKMSKIPILGLIGKYRYKNNLVAYEKPKSAVAESFRAIRSSLQFIFKNNPSSAKANTLMITSSVSGEGKTFTSINIATVYALSGKKTILLGLDLRKPKIFDDFSITNEKGVVNYLIDESTLEEITTHTHIENLDLITSGPIPPNPSELLMGDKLKGLIDSLKDQYDIIILDTPPLGLVTDALELVQYADATIFMIRLNYTKKGMLQLVNSKYKSGELKNISFVLNFFRPKSTHNYGYGYIYGYGYGYGVYGNAYHEKDNKSLLNKLKSLLKRR